MGNHVNGDGLRKSFVVIGKLEGARVIASSQVRDSADTAALGLEQVLVKAQRRHCERLVRGVAAVSPCKRATGQIRLPRKNVQEDADRSATMTLIQKIRARSWSCDKGQRRAVG